jgi:TetR/AcrR family transcriptional repressor of nem operon
MSPVPSTPQETGAASAADPRSRLLDAAVQVIRTKGYAATTVDDVCSAAGVTKGSFFHHFKSKEAMALAAVEHWNRVTGSLFAQAPHQHLPDPRDRVLAYLDLRKALIRGAPPEFTCLLGTMVQETYETWPRLRQACDAGILGHAQTVARDLALAKALYAPHATWTPRTWRCSPRPRCRAPSSWPRRGAAPTSCSRASITCDSMSRTCWAPMTRRLPP